MTFGSVITDMILAAIPAVGFALLFNVPREFLVWCALGGALAHSLRLVFMTYTPMPIELATFLAAAALSFIAVAAAKRLGAHPKVCTVAAIIPMVPGVSAYAALIAVIRINQNGISEQLVHTAVQNTLGVFFIVSALAMGLALPGLTWFRRRTIL